jgi:hypothetical protein
MPLNLSRFAALAIVLITALLLGACEREPVGRNDPPPPRELRMVFPNFSLKALPWGEWKIEQANRDRMVVSKAQGKSLMRLRAEEFRLEATAEGGSFAQVAEAREEQAMSDLQMLSAHYERAVLGGADCLRYDGVYRDPRKAGTADQFLNRKGHVCQHPTRPGIAAQVDFSVRSPTRSPPDIEKMLRQADEVMGTVEFVPAR